MLELRPPSPARRRPAACKALSLLLAVGVLATLTSGCESTPEERNLAYHAWFLNTSERTRSQITPQHHAAAQRVGLNLAGSELEFRLFDATRYDAMRHPERRALSAQIPTAGEYTIQESFVTQLERAMLWIGGVRQVATVMRTAGGEEMLWPTTNDTGNTGAQITGSSASSSAHSWNDRKPRPGPVHPVKQMSGGEV